ncbi:MAG TPA: MFS transporter, partial [Nitrospirae bacterium]|nr:MFS transporter [Nitrospirota bacterium]HEW81445.1 MFS transporter [Nitrospirota bacterium]
MFKIIFSRRMIVAFIMGFACGLPLLLTITVLQAWMKEEGVDLTIIGLFALVGLPYTLKFLWAPFLDRFIPPFLGRRRGWMLIAQIFLMVSIGGLAMTSPADNPWIVAVAAMLVTFFSASQDIVVDAYRREDLRDEELGLGSSFYINGYRLGMLLASGGGLIMADFMSFKAVYLIMAACMLPGIITTLFTPEPVITGGTPASMREAVFDPLIEYFSRNGALWMLAFILFYKVGDT